MKKIQALPKLVFDRNFTNEKIQQFDYAAFISILDIDNQEQKFDTTLENFLQVKMWDIEKDLFENGTIKYEKPSETELQKIVAFVNQHKDKKVFIVHCSAGISRSGAVATFIKDKFYEQVDKETFMQNNKNIQPNLYILKQLKNIDTTWMDK